MLAFFDIYLIDRAFLELMVLEMHAFLDLQVLEMPCLYTTDTYIKVKHPNHNILFSLSKI